MRLAVAVILAAAVALAQPTISGPASCSQGATCNFTASGGTSPYTFSMIAGSGGSITSGGVFSAPSKITPNHQEGGCQVQPNNSVYNTRIDGLPVDSHSATWTGSLNTGIVQVLPSFPGNANTTSASPTTAMNFYYT